MYIFICDVCVCVCLSLCVCVCVCVCDKFMCVDRAALVVCGRLQERKLTLIKSTCVHTCSPDAIGVGGRGGRERKSEGGERLKNTFDWTNNNSR